MKTFKDYVRSMIVKHPFVLNVHAEEPTNTTNVTDNPEGGQQGQQGEEPTNKTTKKDDPKPSGTVNFEDLIAKARKEERDKLYPELNKYKEKVNSLMLVIAERDSEIADLKKELEEVKKENAKLKENVEKGVKTNKTISELTTTISVLERQLEELQAKYDADVTALKLEAFKKEKIAEAGGELIPELVTGNSEEEIIASIELAKQRYQEIIQKAVQNVQMPAANPNQNIIQLKEKSIDEISSMTPQQWAEYRKQLGLK